MDTKAHKRAHKPQFPTLASMRSLVMSVKRSISDEFRAYDEDEIPGILLTVGADAKGNWSYQTGDNSFTGGAYGFRLWAVVGVYRRSNARQVAQEIINQFAEAFDPEVDGR